MFAITIVALLLFVGASAELDDTRVSLAELNPVVVVEIPVPVLPWFPPSMG